MCPLSGGAIGGPFASEVTFLNYGSHSIANFAQLMDLSHVQATHLSRDGSASRFRRTYDDIKTRSGLILYAFQQEVKVLVILCNE